MKEIVHIHIKLVNKKDDTPLNGEEYTIRFYDKDPLKDDFIGESTVDDFGHAQVFIKRSDFRSCVSLKERYPDVYFVVLKNGKTILKSPIFQNLPIDSASDFPATESKHWDLGTFIIPNS